VTVSCFCGEETNDKIETKTKAAKKGKDEKTENRFLKFRRARPVDETRAGASLIV